VWICADDFAAYVSGTYGNALAQTPNLDRLADQGIRFDRAYCSCPLSTPSRMAFLTGRHPHLTRVRLTRTPLPQSEVTIGNLLRGAGYESIACGKTHYYEPLTREFDRCIDLPRDEAKLRSRPASPLPGDVEVLGPWRPFRDPARVWLNSACLPYRPDSEMPDTFLANAAREILSEPRARPLFLWVGFYATHSPFRFPIEFRGRFEPAAFDLPQVRSEDRSQIPPVFEALTDNEKRGIIAAYYTTVTYMDRNVGTILDALERSGQAERTLVVFNSDHGYLLGHHGRFEKHCCFEEAVRTALLVRLPGTIAGGRATDALVELIDVVPTVLELCGVEIPRTIAGRSLAPILTQQTSRHRESVIAEYADNAEAMVRTDRWKLIYSAGNRRRCDGYDLGRSSPGRTVRLYDLDQDPQETRDLAGRPENREIVSACLAALADRLRITVRGTRPTGDSRDLHDALARRLLPDLGQ
jgi:choline-sulfatase